MKNYGQDFIAHFLSHTKEAYSECGLPLTLAGGVVLATERDAYIIPIVQGTPFEHRIS